MKFNDTTNNSGLIQDCEFWTNLGDTSISGETSLLKRFTSLINSAYDEVLPYIFSSDNTWSWDDPNHTDLPIGTTNIVSGQSDYKFIADENGNSILEIESAYLSNGSGTFNRIAGTDSYSATDPIFAQNSTNTGTPTGYDIRSNSIFLDPVPNYSVMGGLRVLFKRAPSYFASSDTTKTPGIPAPFHRMLSLIASRDYVAVHKPENVALLATINRQIDERKQQLSSHIARRSKDHRPIMRVREESAR